MKKLLILITSCLLASCMDNIEEKKALKVKDDIVKEKHFVVVDITVRNECHEYLCATSYTGGLEHLPNCIYCKERENKKSQITKE